MAKINVKLQAFYGFSCGGCSHGSEETLEVEVNEKELEALLKLGTEEISCKAVVEAIENGETELQSLHERLEEEFYIWLRSTGSMRLIMNAWKKVSLMLWKMIWRKVRMFLQWLWRIL